MRKRTKVVFYQAILGNQLTGLTLHGVTDSGLYLLRTEHGTLVALPYHRLIIIHK